MQLLSRARALVLGLSACAHGVATPDPVAIRDVIDRTSDAINHREWDALDAFFTPDAVWEARPPVRLLLHGRDEIHRFLRTNASAIDVLSISVATSAVDVLAADRARVRSTMHELIRVKATDAALQIVGTYVDELVKRDGRWRIARRTFEPRFEADVPVPGRIYRDGAATTTATDSFPGGRP